jgi:hypothetical protein
MAFDMKAYHRKYYLVHRKAILRRSKKRWDANKDEIKSYRRQWWHTVKNDYAHMQRDIYRKARHRAKKAGLPFNISPDDIVIPSHCPVFGISLSVQNGRHNDKSPALDRTIPKRGYVKGNVQIISQRANVLKRDASLKELEKLVRYLRRITH